MYALFKALTRQIHRRLKAREGMISSIKQYGKLWEVWLRNKKEMVLAASVEEWACFHKGTLVMFLVRRTKLLANAWKRVVGVWESFFTFIG